MNYLFPIPYNYSEIVAYDYSNMAVDASTREVIKSWVKDKLANIDINTNDKQTLAATLVITIITPMAIAYLPRFIVLGCAAISAIVYVEFAKMVETRSGTLKATLIAQRVIEYLIDPTQKKGQKLKKDLEEAKQKLEKLEADSLSNKTLFGEDLHPQNTKDLKKNEEQRKTDLENQLKSLESDLPYFQKNADLLTKLADIWQKIDRNDENRMSACRDFMFYSLMGTALIHIGRLKELIGKTDYTQYITYPSLIIALGVVSVVYAAKQAAFSILAYRNDEARKALLAIIENEKKRSLFEQLPYQPNGQEKASSLI